MFSVSKEMHNVKTYLYNKYGGRCEVCGQPFALRELTGHHVIMKCRGGKITIKNILLACYYCHFVTVNDMPYNTAEYWEAMNNFMRHREDVDKENFPSPAKK